MSTFNINGSCVFNFYGRSDGGYDINREYEGAEAPTEEEEDEDEVTAEDGGVRGAAAPAEDDGAPVPPQQDRVRDRDMRRVFSNGDVIRHKAATATTDDYWFAYYRSEDNCIVANGIKYKSLSGFCKAHYKRLISEARIHTRRTPNTNGWIACDVLRDGVWVNCDTL